MIIAWEGYIDHRTGKKRKKKNHDKDKPWTSLMLFKDQMSVKWYECKRASIYNWMQCVFFLFILTFSFEIIYVLILLSSSYLQQNGNCS